MYSLSELEELLESQFGPFIRDSRYKEAFDRALASMRHMEQTPAKIDVFYLFMHQLIMELFDEIDRLSSKLNHT